MGKFGDRFFQTRGILFLLLIYISIGAVVTLGVWDQVAAKEPAAGNKGAHLQSVSVDSDTDGLVVQLGLEGPLSYRVWSTPSPSKVIIDLHNTVVGTGVQGFALDDVLAKRVRITQYPNYSRVVVDLAHSVPTPIHEVQGNTLMVYINRNYRQGYETLVAPGVRYGQFRQGGEAGQVLVNYLRVSPRSRASIRPVLAKGGAGGLETVDSMAKAHDAIAAVNGNFFAGNGKPLGFLMIDGEIAGYPIYNRSAFGITATGQVLIDQVDAVGYFQWADREPITISGVNRVRRTDDLILYTPEYGKTTGTNHFGLEVVVEQGVVIACSEEGNSLIPPQGFVLSAHGNSRELLSDIAVGDPVTAHWELRPDWIEMGVVHAVGAGPRLVKDGKIAINGVEERFQSDVLYGRAPRTGFGVTETGEIVLVTVNGRRGAVSVGMTLRELAELMITLGAVDAINLDGGGSATLVVRDRVLNLPSDGRERPVGSAILVLAD
ncbi:MAG: AMIN domain-containing protein [Firmicutes bacterium]|nr:AMIN domain-containing protein [Bacillota bacterium]